MNLGFGFGSFSQRPTLGRPKNRRLPDGTGRRRSLLPRLLRRAAGVLGALVLLGAVGIGGLWPLTPSVGDAEARITTRLAQLHGRDAHALPVPDRVGQALIATEDSRFYAHHGIDVVGITRAVLGPLRGNSGDPGGATLNQQLAKVLYTPTGSSPIVKVEQLELALKIDAHYSKAQILEMYLNAVYFGHGFYGLPAASRGYFHRAPADLNWAQASLLAGLLQAPSAYDPLRHLHLARARQGHVLDRLVQTHVLSAGQAAAAAQAPLYLAQL